MGPDDAVKATSFLKPETVIPCHYNTWPLIEQDTDAWISQTELQTDSEPVVLEVGASFEL